MGSVSWVPEAAALVAAVTSVGLLLTEEDPVGAEVRLGLSLAWGGEPLGADSAEGSTSLQWIYYS